MKRATMLKRWHLWSLTLIGFLLPWVAFAQEVEEKRSVLDFSPPRTDASIMFLSRIFGNVGIDAIQKYPGVSEIIPKMFGVFNAIVLVLAAFVMVVAAFGMDVAVFGMALAVLGMAMAVFGMDLVVLGMFFWLASYLAR